MVKDVITWKQSLPKNATIHKVCSLVPGDNHSVGSSVPVASSWLRPGNRTFLEVASIVAT